MALDKIILKNGTYAAIPGVTPSIEIVSGDRGEPLWARDTHNLYIRDGDGKLKSILPDIVGAATGATPANIRTRVGAATNGEIASLSGYFILAQSPTDEGGVGYNYKRITINQMLTNSGLVDDKYVKVRELDPTAGYLSTKLRAPASAFTNPIALTTQTLGGDEYLQITGYRANEGGAITQVGGVYIAAAPGLVYNHNTGELKAAIAQGEAGAAGVAKFHSADFNVAIDGTASAKVTRFVFANEGDNVLQTVGGKLAYTTDLSPLEINISDKTLVTKKYVVDKLLDFNRLIDFKQSVEFVTSTQYANLANIGTGVPSYEGVAVSEGDRVLLIGLDANLRGVYVLTLTGTIYSFVKSGDFPIDVATAKAYMGSMFACTHPTSVNRGVWMVYNSVFNSDYSFGRIKDEQQFIEGDAVEIVPTNAVSGTQYEFNVLYDDNTLEIVTGELKVHLDPAGGLSHTADGIKIAVVNGGTWGA